MLTTNSCCSALCMYMHVCVCLVVCTCHSLRVLALCPEQGHTNRRLMSLTLEMCEWEAGGGALQSSGRNELWVRVGGPPQLCYSWMAASSAMGAPILALRSGCCCCWNLFVWLGLDRGWFGFFMSSLCVDACHVSLTCITWASWVVWPLSGAMVVYAYWQIFVLCLV